MVMKQETPPVDGELSTPDKYAEANAHRDPLLLRVREHVSLYGCAYVYVGAAILTLILISTMTGESIFIIALVVFVPLGYVVLMANSPKNNGK